MNFEPAEIVSIYLRAFGFESKDQRSHSLLEFGFNRTESDHFHFDKKFCRARCWCIGRVHFQLRVSAFDPSCLVGHDSRLTSLLIEDLIAFFVHALWVVALCPLPFIHLLTKTGRSLLKVVSVAR